MTGMVLFPLRSTYCKYSQKNAIFMPSGIGGKPSISSCVGMSNASSSLCEASKLLKTRNPCH